MPYWTVCWSWVTWVGTDQAHLVAAPVEILCKKEWPLVRIVCGGLSKGPAAPLVEPTQHGRRPCPACLATVCMAQAAALVTEGEATLA